MKAWVPVTCISRIFLYLWSKVRSMPWPLDYKSMEKNENDSRSMCTDRKSPNNLESWWVGTAAITKVFFFVNNSWLKRDRTLGMASLCSSHQDAATDMQHDLFWSLRDLDLRLNFDFNLSRLTHISFKASQRVKHDNAIDDSLSLLVQKLFGK